MCPDVSRTDLMMLRPATLRPALRVRCTAECARAARRTIFTQKQSTRATQDFDLNKLNAKRRDYEHNRTAFLAAGAIAGIISFVYTAWKIKKLLDAEGEKEKNTVQFDSVVPTETFKTEAGEKRKVVLHDDEGREIVPTGNSTVPTLPRTIEVKVPATQAQEPIAASITVNDGTEFTLVGLGTRTVSFLGIQVYVFGFYVATQDVERLQHYLVKKINPLATTLIPSEKDQLRKSLLDAAEGEETWNTILRDAGCRSLFRITPVRNTDFHHMRDAFVRSITGRSQRDKSCNDDAFGAAMVDFRAIFNRGSVPKNKELVLLRDNVGKLSVLYGSGDIAKPERSVVGMVADERVSRLLWLHYLAGKSVASESARQNIIEGIMEFVERPVGTVATQVV